MASDITPAVKDSPEAVRKPTYYPSLTADGRCCSRHNTELVEFFSIDGELVLDCQQCYNESPNAIVDRDFLSYLDLANRVLGQP